MFANIAGAAGRIRPSAIYSCVDQLRVWVRQLTDKEHQWFDKHCDYFRPHPSPALFNYSLKVRMHLYGPDQRALEELAGRSDVHFNYFEPGLDWVFRYDTSAEEARDTWHFHIVKPYHRGQEMGFGESDGNYTWYTSRRRKVANNTAAYSDKRSRITGESNTCHIDYRITGAQALHRAKLGTIADVLNADPSTFWADNRLLLCALDSSRFGRLFHNSLVGSKRRTPMIKRYNHGLIYDHDARVGETIIRDCGCIQKVLDEFPYAHRCLVRMDIKHLLPPPGSAWTPYYDLCAHVCDPKSNPFKMKRYVV